MATPLGICFIGLVFLLNPYDVDSLSCFECDDLYKPYYCDIITTCTPGEVCFVDQVVTSAGNILFKSGCRSTERCSTVKRGVHVTSQIHDVTNEVKNSTKGNEDSPSDILVCSQCCSNKDYCNMEGCQEAAVPRQQRGPYCFDCNKQGKHGCRHVKQCDVHYSCEITTEELNNVTLYNSHCVHPTSSKNCAASSLRAGAVSSGTGSCPKCCDEDFCNEDCTPSSIADGGYGPWQAWSSCPHTCGRAGFQTRGRSCLTSHCEGKHSETRDCNFQADCPTVDGNWSKWGTWGSCFASSCTSTRTRTCTDPAPSAAGKYCVGSSYQRMKCTIHGSCPADGGYGPWQAWSACPHTCGGTGFQTRDRMCLTSHCDGKHSETRDCNFQSDCPIDGGFTLWTSWSTCSTSCGNKGHQQRSRQCTNPPPSHGGKSCIGHTLDTKWCKNHVNCPAASANYVEWSQWTHCSRTCGSMSGVKQRTKTCYNQFHHIDMSLCTQPLLEQQACKPGINCPVVNGGWTSWHSWGHCSTTCGKGMSQRFRSCTNPIPRDGGKQCSGDRSERRMCDYTGRCSLTDSGYTAWGQWSHCAGNIGYQTQTRSRTCPQGRTNHGNCQGLNRETIPCNTNGARQPVDGQWASWGRWSRCNPPCGAGLSTRNRQCNKPAPQNGGKNCVGDRVQTVNCTTPCPEAACSAVTDYHMYMYHTSVTHSNEKAYVCLRFSHNMQHWYRASAACKKDGGKLAAFDSYEEDNVAFAQHIHNMYPRHQHMQIWIGLQNVQEAWRWEDGTHIGYYASHKLGTSLNTVSSKNFTHNACVLDDGHDWTVVDCGEKHYYMCERKVD